MRLRSQCWAQGGCACAPRVEMRGEALALPGLGRVGMRLRFQSGDEGGMRLRSQGWAEGGMRLRSQGWAEEMMQEFSQHLPNSDHVVVRLRFRLG